MGACFRRPERDGPPVILLGLKLNAINLREGNLPRCAKRHAHVSQVAVHAVVGGEAVTRIHGYFDQAIDLVADE